MKSFFLVIFIVISFSLSLFAQQSKLSKSVNYISGFIASDYFNSLKKDNDDLALADSIYLRALKFNKNNISETLFSLTFATVPYRKIPVVIPLIHSIVYFPLTSAEDSIYHKKNANLPKNFFFDTPQNSYGDKDKLAHFFGSAFLAYSSNVFDLGDLIGYFVEAFEEEFKVQSKIDFRDLQTNDFGNMFGNSLKKDNTILPSQIMILKTLFYFRYHL